MYLTDKHFIKFSNVMLVALNQFCLRTERQQSGKSRRFSPNERALALAEHKRWVYTVAEHHKGLHGCEHHRVGMQTAEYPRGPSLDDRLG